MSDPESASLLNNYQRPSLKKKYNRSIGAAVLLLLTSAVSVSFLLYNPSN